MANSKWDLKLNYMLAFNVCKYDLNPERWTLIAHDLADSIKTTPQNCETQFNILCQEYGGDWKMSEGPLQNYVFAVIKRHYYGDLSERLTESRDLLVAIYDFIRLYQNGQIVPNEIYHILQDIRNTSPNNDGEREQKLKYLRRLRHHMLEHNLAPSDYSSHAVELLSLPSSFQQNDVLREKSMVSSENNDQHTHSINENILQINSNDDSQQENLLDISSVVEQPKFLKKNENQDDSTNRFSNTPSVSNETSNSVDRNKFEIANGITSVNSNQSSSDNVVSIDGHDTLNTNDQINISNGHNDLSLSSSNDLIGLHSYQIQAKENHIFCLDNTRSSLPLATTKPIDDDELARMDSEQVPESVPADITDVPTPNDNAMFVADESIQVNHDRNILITNEKESGDNMREKNLLTEENRDLNLTTNPKSNNFRKSIQSILNNIKNAKYGLDFSKSLKSFKLPDKYYECVKMPVDIPDIRERMHRGDYDNNIHLFERDIFLMFNNALFMYKKNVDIHGHAQYMMKYAIELFTSVDDVCKPWMTNQNQTDEDISINNNPDNETDNSTHLMSSVLGRSPMASPLSSSHANSTTLNLRRQTIATSYPTPKRQRKTAN